LLAVSNIFIRNKANLFLLFGDSSPLTMVSSIHMLSIPISPRSCIPLNFHQNWNEFKLTGYIHIMQDGKSQPHNLLFCPYHEYVTHILPEHLGLIIIAVGMIFCIYIPSIQICCASHEYHVPFLTAAEFFDRESASTLFASPLYKFSRPSVNSGQCNLWRAMSG